MPYKLRKAPRKNLYWVVTTETGKKHSKLPIPMEKAKAQLRILESTLKGGKLDETWPLVKDHLDEVTTRVEEDPRNPLFGKIPFTLLSKLEQKKELEEQLGAIIQELVHRIDEKHEKRDLITRGQTYIGQILSSNFYSPVMHETEEQLAQLAQQPVGRIIGNVSESSDIPVFRRLPISQLGVGINPYDPRYYYLEDDDRKQRMPTEADDKEEVTVEDSVRRLREMNEKYTRKNPGPGPFGTDLRRGELAGGGYWTDEYIRRANEITKKQGLIEQVGLELKKELKKLPSSKLTLGFDKRKEAALKKALDKLIDLVKASNAPAAAPPPSPAGVGLVRSQPIVVQHLVETATVPAPPAPGRRGPQEEQRVYFNPVFRRQVLDTVPLPNLAPQEQDPTGKYWNPLADDPYKQTNTFVMNDGTLKTLIDDADEFNEWMKAGQPEIPDYIMNVYKLLIDTEEELMSRARRGIPLTDVQKRFVDAMLGVSNVGGSKLSKAHKRALEHQTRSKRKLIGGGHYTNQIHMIRGRLTAGRNLTQRQQAEIKNLFDRTKRILKSQPHTGISASLTREDRHFYLLAKERADKQATVDTFERELTQYLNELPRVVPAGTENPMTFAEVQTGDLMTDVNRKYYGRPQKIYGIEERQWLQGAPGRTVSDTREVVRNLQNYVAHVRGTPRPQSRVDVTPQRSMLQRTYDSIFGRPETYADETPQIWQEYTDGTDTWFSAVNANNQPYGDTVWTIPDYAIERGDEVRRINGGSRFNAVAKRAMELGMRRKIQVQ